MEYVQERIATLHDLAGRVPDAPADEACVVVPMTERDYDTEATARTLTELAAFDPGRVVVALRSPPDRATEIQRWLDGFDLPLDTLWCNSDRMKRLLESHGLNGSPDKGRDLWLALGVAATNHEYVVVHDADCRTVDRDDFARLLTPLTGEFSFVKGYYARVENRRLYGRLFRLFYSPLLRALRERNDAPILDYLGAFRYALAGEFAATSSFVREMRGEPGFGFEIATLGEAFDLTGFGGSAQVDLGRYEHDHRPVTGPTGLSDMSEDIADALFRVVKEHGITPDYATLPDAYHTAAERLVRQYAADAAFNGFEYDVANEHEQIEAYAPAITPPGEGGRLPAWSKTDLDPADVLAASHEMPTKTA